VISYFLGKGHIFDQQNTNEDENGKLLKSYIAIMSNPECKLQDNTQKGNI
jgi:hypothetical protein